MKIEVLLLILMLMSCSSDYPKIDIQGHRGWRGLYPENSMPGFAAAIELGVTTLELDVVISADSQVIISHEPWISAEICDFPDGEVDQRALNIFKMPYEDIKKYDCGSKIHSRFSQQKKMAVAKPLLNDLLELLQEKDPDQTILLNIETKSNPESDDIFHPRPDVFVDILMATLEGYNASGVSCIQSFDIRTLQEVRKRYQDQTVALLVDEKEAYKDKIQELGFSPDIISPYYRLVSKEMVDALHQEGILIKPWTVNESSDMIRMIDYGVDGIITDYPQRLIHIVNKRP